MRDLQEKVESDATGRAAISGVILFVLLTLLASNLSTSGLQDWISGPVEPVRNGLGLDQAWGVFAPDPRSTIYGLEGRITYDDGTTEKWHWPRGDPIVSEFRAYHWQKWSEQVRLDDQSGLWQPFAEWLARTHDRPDRHPTDITLIRFWADLNPPGTRPSRGPWNRFEFFTLQVNPSILGAGAPR
jgi:hypothetical protein